MKRNVTMEEISDGKLYEINDLVKADCNDCMGCSSCCQGMGKSIILDPYDVFILSNELEMTFEELLSNYMELNVVDGIILPNLKMNETTDRCSFLNNKGRCSIHEFRPGMCRLFPLGRYYENNEFKYFLQVNECKNKNRSKIKVKKWLDMPEVVNHEKFVNEWHYFLLEIEKKLDSLTIKESKEINMNILNTFFIKSFNVNFYETFYNRIKDFNNKKVSALADT